MKKTNSKLSSSQQELLDEILVGWSSEELQSLIKASRKEIKRRQDACNSWKNYCNKSK